MPLHKNCLMCGKPFSVIPSKGHYKNCSTPCSGKYRSKYMRGERAPTWKNAGIKTCINCKQEFKAYDSYRKYCGLACFNYGQVAEAVASRTLRAQKASATIKLRFGPPKPRLRARTNLVSFCKDGNHDAIVEHFQSLGAGVLETNDLGWGYPDVLVSIGQIMAWVEIKNPKTRYGRRNHGRMQQKLVDKGWWFEVVRNEADAELVVDRLRRAWAACADEFREPLDVTTTTVRVDPSKLTLTPT